jgi:hypothetical protein
MGAKKGHALVAKLESVHMLAIEAEAFWSAVDDVYHRGLWSGEHDAEHRRDLNHMECFLDHLRETINRLLAEAQEAVKLATRPARQCEIHETKRRGPEGAALRGR